MSAKGILPLDSKFLLLLAIFRAMLLPRIFRLIGWVLLLPLAVLCAEVQFGHYVIPFLDFNTHPKPVGLFEVLGMRYDYSDEATTTALIIVLLFIAFGRIKNETELTGKIRLQALYWSATITWAITALYLPTDILPKMFGIESRVLEVVFQLASAFVINSFLVPVVLFIPIFGYLKRKIKHEDQLKRVYLLPYMPFNLIGKCATMLYLFFGIVVLLFETGYSLQSDIMMLFPIALALWTCSKERTENAAIYETRLRALQISVMIHYVLVVIAYWLVYGGDFLVVLQWSISSLALIFLMVFYWMRYKAPKQAVPGAIAEAS